MKFAGSSKNALIVLTMALVLFAPALLSGCKSGADKEQAQVAEKVEATTLQVQKMTDEQIKAKAIEIQQKKGTDPANMSPEERTIIGQAVVKGLI